MLRGVAVALLTLGLGCYSAPSAGPADGGPGDGAADDGPQVDAPPPAVYRSVALGLWHSCGIRTDGSLWCWGRNDERQVRGAGNPTLYELQPVRYGTATDWTLVAAGEDATCGIHASDDTLECWGGLPGAPQSGTWSAIAVGDNHGCAIDETSGRLSCWGDNGDGQLGDGTFVDSTDAPVPVTGGAPAWSAVSAGRWHTCAVGADGSLWCWGTGSNGELGNGGQANAASPAPVGTDLDWTAVAAGDHHTCGLRGNGLLFCWGANWAGEAAGDDDQPDSHDSEFLGPRQVTGTWASVTTGDDHTCGRRTDGTAACWGSGLAGQIGNNTATDTRVQATLPQMWKAIAAGGSHSCGIQHNEMLHCWGSTLFGQVGVPRSTLRTRPDDVDTLSGWSTAAGALSAGKVHTCGIRSLDGTLRCWGANGWGQLGGGPGADAWSDVPRAVVDLGGGMLAAGSVTAGQAHSCAVLPGGAGQAACWGANSSMQLGDGSGSAGDPEPTPIVVADPDPWLRLAAGEDHTCGIKMDGKAWCWGDGEYGHLGIGGTGDQSSPVAVTTPATLTAPLTDISAGEDHTCAVAGDGTLHCWGRNDEGQVGTGAVPSPVLVPTMVAVSGALQVAAGGKHTCAVTMTGALFCWGYNRYGQLGVDSGTYPSLANPIAVAPPIGAAWRSVSAGDRHTCAVTDAKELYCWGKNGVGQLGDGSLANRWQHGSPVASDIEVVAAGVEHTCAIDTGGRARCWGRGDSGQLGNDAAAVFAPRLVP